MCFFMGKPGIPPTKDYAKGGRKPTQYPYNVGEGWEKGGPRVGKARQGPPNAHTMWGKDGQSMDQRWATSEKPQPILNITDRYDRQPKLPPVFVFKQK